MKMFIKGLRHYGDFRTKIKGCRVFALLLILQFTSGLVAEAQDKKAQKEIVKNVENITNMIISGADISLEEFGYLLPGKADFVVEDKAGLSFESQKVALIPPGEYSFGYRRITTVKGATMGHQASSGNVSVGFSYTPTTQVQSKLITVDAVFEAGKCYTTEYEARSKGIFKEDSISTRIVEVTDEKIIENTKKDIESAKNYLAWSQNHFGMLDGTYKTKSGTERVTFSGNKIRISTTIFGVTNIYNGTFWFDNNTIIVNVESFKLGRQKQESSTGIFTEVRYYTLIDDMLEIADKSGSTMFSSKGKYYKSSVTEIIDNENTENMAELQAVPTPLEGIYIDKDRKHEITFTGNKFHISMPFNGIFNGTFLLDAETITLNIESKGKNNKPCSHTEVLYYKLNDNVLEITAKSGGLSSVVPNNIKRQYNKSLGSRLVKFVFS